MVESKALLKMSPYNRYSTIDTSMVCYALHHLRFWSKPKADQPLENLLVVDLLLRDLDIPLRSNQRGFALREILVSTITENLSAHRRKFGLSMPHEDEDFQGAQCAVIQDGRNGNVELLGWCLLYYFYVRTDLNFSYKLFADLIGVDVRSVRRYQQHAIRKLTDRLIQREWQARKSYRQRYAYTRLPVAKPIRLIGRDAELTRAHYIFDQLEWKHMQVIGADGVGKTIFVQEFLRQRIDREVFDRVIWIDQPHSVAAVRWQLTDHFNLDGGHTTLRELLATYHVGVVMDGVEHLEAELQALRMLLDDLSEATAILINRTRLPLANLPACIHLRELEQVHALMLIRKLAEAQVRGSEVLSDDVIGYIWQTAGGNPGAIHQGIHALERERVS